ncbi:MAG: DNA primase [Solirubrobacterales bacterium]
MFLSGGTRDDLVAEIENRIDIVELVGETIELTRKGNRYWGICPFHGERTASFSVSRERGLFYCFGCHTGGNLFTFVMKQRNCDFKEAIDFLAVRAGIDMSRYVSAQNRQKTERSRQFLEINRDAAKFYQNLLKSAEGKTALEYIRKRGLSDETIERFGLGYAPDDWRRLQEHLVKKGYPTDVIVASGLVKKSQSSESYLDTFRNRVIFPIQNASGSVIAFGGRILSGEGPKYLNSPETPVYSKRHHLFGLYQAKDELVKHNEAILVEGYMDCIQLHQQGVSNVVAALGTSFTAEQAKLIKRFAQQLTILYDGDEAGKRETARALTVLEAESIPAYIVTLPGGQDPDEFVAQLGKEEFLVFIKNNRFTALEYKLQILLSSDFATTQAGKTQIMLNLFSDVDRETAVVSKTQSLALIARRLGLPERDVEREFVAWKRQNETGSIRNRNLISSNNKKYAGNAQNQEFEERLLYKMIDDPAIFRSIRQTLGLTFFSNPVLCRLAQTCDGLHITDNPGDALVRLQEALVDDPELGNQFARLSFIGEEKPLASQEIFDFVRNKQTREKRTEWHSFYDRINQLEADGDFIAALRYIAEMGRMSRNGQEGGKK